MRKLLLVDGSSLLSSSFYASAPMAYVMAKTEEEREKAVVSMMKSEAGEYTNGVNTMMHTLENIIRDQKPSHLAVAWDISRDTWRRDLYPEYKGTRKETPKELKAQFLLAQKVLESMNIKQLMIPKYEADDILGSLSRRYEQDISTVILTKDQDALQLVTDYTRLWLDTKNADVMMNEMSLNRENVNIPKKVVELTPQSVKHFFGVHPHQIPDKKALQGDTSDNIPGVKGVGPTSIIPLLSEFETVEDLYDFIEDSTVAEFKALTKELGIKQSPLGSLTKTSDTEIVGKESALLSKKLATIVCDLPEEQLCTLSEMELNINSSGREAIYRELGLKNLLNKVPVMAY